MISILRPSLLVLACCLVLAAGARAETIKVGLLKTVGAGPIFIAQEKGYFAAEGLEIQDVVFDSAEPIAVATVSGSIDIGATGLTAGFYTLAGQGALKMLASESFERAGFQGQAVLVSNRAWEGGLKAFTDWPGHSVAISQVFFPSWDRSRNESRTPFSPTSLTKTGLPSFSASQCLPSSLIPM